MFTLKHLATTTGPSPHASDPVIVVAFGLSDDELAASARRVGKIRGLCSRWFDAPALSAQPEAIEIAHFLALWARAMLNEVAGCVVTAHARQAAGHLEITLGYHHPKLAFDTLHLAVQLLHDADQLDATKLEEALKPMWDGCRSMHPDPQVQPLIKHALRAGIPCRQILPGSRHWLFGWGARSEIFHECCPLSESHLGVRISDNKFATKHLFKDLGVPQAPGVLVNQETELEAAAKTVGYPCVTKPLDIGRTDGVTVDIRNLGELVLGFRTARQFSPKQILVERHVPGEIHRILLIRGRFWMAVRRPRPCMTGDGRSTVRQLTEAYQAEIAAKHRPGSRRGQLPVDESYYVSLEKQGLSPDSVPAAGREVCLRNLPLSRTGATNYQDLASITHPDVVKISEMLAKVLGLEVCGIDYITEDIRKSCFGHGAFIEVNNFPGLTSATLAGLSEEEVGGVVLGDKPARIPCMLVVAQADQLGSIPLPAGQADGWVRDLRTGVGSLVFPDRLGSLHDAVDRIVRNPTVESLTIIASPEQFAASGLPVHRTSRTIVHAGTGLSPDWLKTLKAHADDFTDLGAQ